MLVLFTSFLTVACAISDGLVDQAVHRAPRTPLVELVVERDGNRRLPDNIALSRRAYDFAFYFHQRGDLDRARKALDASLRFDPGYALAYAARCALRSELDDQKGAIEDADRAIELSPKMPEAYYNRGVAYGRLRDWAHAEKDYTQALRLNPTLGNGGVHNNLGSALMAQGKLDDAISNFSRAIELNPKNAISLFNRSLAHERAGHVDQSMADLNSTLELVPNFPEAHHRRAQLLMGKGLDREALEDLNTALRLYPKDLVALADRALLHERMGNGEEALLDFRRFSEISNEDPRKIDREKHLSPF